MMSLHPVDDRPADHGLFRAVHAPRLGRDDTRQIIDVLLEQLVLRCGAASLTGLGVQDLLDKMDVGNPLRNELVAVEGILGQSVADTSDGARAYIADYRRRTREIREMKVVQSYATKDAAGNVDLNLVRAMVADLERERATPGSMAQAVSDEKMADLYRLIANWNDPSNLGCARPAQPALVCLSCERGI